MRYEVCINDTHVSYHDDYSEAMRALSSTRMLRDDEAFLVQFSDNWQHPKTLIYMGRRT